jgi:RNA-directed DNA polymerase
VEFDIKGLFDNLDHTLLMKAVRKHTENKWVILYIERWLKAPLQTSDGTLTQRTQGTPQGGVISPVLSNLFLHYVFDVWMEKHHHEKPWCRYADDGLVHCKTEQEAQQIIADLKNRFAECRLELHPEKTKIIYCKDGNRRMDYPRTEFEFLGYGFRSREARNKNNQVFQSFTPGASKRSLQLMRSKTREQKFYRRTELSLKDIAQKFNPILRGWIEYYGKYNRSSLYSVFRHFNRTLITWGRRKYKKLGYSRIRAARFVEEISKNQPHLFAHWKIGMVGAFA